MNYLISLGKDIINKRRLILDLAKADFRKRFVGSYFGVVWMFVQPIATVAIYYFVFGLGLRNGDPIEGVPFVLWLVPGIVPWFFFSEALNAGTNCLQEYSYLVKKVVFPVEMLPIIKLLSCAMVHGFFLLIMCGLYFCYQWWPAVTWIQVIYYSFAAFMLALGLNYLTSSIQVFFKDMAQIVGIMLQFGMWMVPIMYDEGLFTARAPWIGIFFKLNPFYYIVVGYRDSMLTGNWFWERPTLTLYFWAVTAVLFLFGLKVFKRLRPHFSDVL